MEWRTVVHEGRMFEHYEVCSINGDIRNKKTGRILKQKVINSGYKIVGLHENGEQYDFLVHRLVAFTYPDKIPNDNPTVKTTINHKDENPLNNSVDNLEWMSPYDQVHYKERIDRQTKTMTERHGKCVYCVELGRTFESLKQASVETGVNKKNISACCHKRLKTAGGFHWEFVEEK